MQPSRVAEILIFCCLWRKWPYTSAHFFCICGGRHFIHLFYLWNSVIMIRWRAKPQKFNEFVPKKTYKSLCADRQEVAFDKTKPFSWYVLWNIIHFLNLHSFGIRFEKVLLESIEFGERPMSGTTIASRADFERLRDFETWVWISFSTDIILNQFSWYWGSLPCCM